MKQLSSKTVHTTWMQMNLLDSEGMEKVGMQFYRKQPHAYAYLLDKAEDPRFNQDERELLLYLGIGVWQMVLKAIPRFPTPKEVPPAALEEADMVNQMLFVEGGQEKWDELADAHVQPGIMSHLKSQLEEPPREAEVREENRLPLLMALTTILDCLSDT